MRAPCQVLMYVFSRALFFLASKLKGPLLNGHPRLVQWLGSVNGRSAKGGPKIALRGDGMGARRRKVLGPLFCVRTDVATKGAGTQILTRKIFS